MNPVLQIEYLVVVAAGVLVLGGFCAWRSSVKARPYVRLIVTVARILGIVCLLTIAVNPGRWEEEHEEKNSEWAIMVDRSLSMSADDVDGRSRWDEALRLAEKARAFAEDPDRSTLLTFSDTLEQAGGPIPTPLEPDGKTTDILQSGTILLNRFRSAKKDLTGIILISDGRQIRTSNRSDLAIRARAQESPFFTVCLGGEVAIKDLSVTAAHRRLVAFVGQKTRITARIENKGLGNIRPTLQLLDPSCNIISGQSVRIENDQTASVSFEVVPDQRGYYEYTVKIKSWQGESVLSNNETGIGMSVLGSKMRILTVEGVPYWDSKFLAQLLRKQPNTEVTSVYRVSSERFFKVETDTSQASESNEPIFPDDEQAMSIYDLVVFGKGVEYFLTPARIKLLRDFVRDQGGCVVFCRSKPYSGTFPALEPLEPVSWGEPIDAEFRFKPTEAGEDAGLFGAMLPKRDDPLWNRLPPLNHAHRCPRLKSFSRVLAEGVLTSAGKTRAFPLVVSRRYGKGVVIAFNADGLWQWDFFPSIKETGNMYGELWTQFFQWAATYSEFLPGQEFSMRLSENRVFPDTPVRIRISLRGIADETDAPELRVMLGEKQIRKLAAVRTPGADRNWDAILSLSEPGTYRVELIDSDKPDFQGPCLALHVTPLPTERDDFSSDPDFLKGLAEDSGGRLLTEDDLEEAVRTLEHETETVDLAKATWEPLWDKWWYLCLMLSFFAIECFFRRKNGLL